jgi:hypothetical protein
MVSKTSRLLSGAAVLAACVFAPTAASAQSNPFLPASAASRAEIERIVDEKLKSVEARVTAAIKSATPASVPGAAGAAGAPGALPGSPGSPLTPGSAIPGAALPGAPGGVQNYGPPPGNGGGQMMAPVEQMDPIEQARSSGTKFLGCINGVPKFVRSQTGERVTFSASDINRAIKSGSLPACR